MISWIFWLVLHVCYTWQSVLSFTQDNLLWCDRSNSDPTATTSFSICASSALAAELWMKFILLLKQLANRLSVSATVFAVRLVFVTQTVSIFTSDGYQRNSNLSSRPATKLFTGLGWELNGYLQNWRDEPWDLSESVVQSTSCLQSTCRVDAQRVYTTTEEQIR